MRRDWTWLVMLGAVALMATACGDDGDSGGGDDDDDDMVDAGPPPDAEEPEPDCWGGPCTGDGLTECPGQVATARLCFEESITEFGSARFPVVTPDGTPRTEPFEETVWEGGYCTLVDRSEPICTSDAQCTFMGCDGRCLGVGQGLTGCFLACDPGAGDNGPCRDGYQCDPAAGACVTGCRTDDECRTALEDTNMNGELDAFDFTDNFNGDRWVYDTASEATCNQDTFRCDNPGTPGAMAGDPCERSSQCMEDGTCFAEASGFPGGGYCVKTNCTGVGRACAEGEICQSKGFGQNACLLECEFAAELAGATPENPFPEAAFQGGIGCREGYQCEWIGTADPVTMRGRTEGACLPANYNDIRENNVGDTCTSDDECFSPLGNGFCNAFTVNLPGGPEIRGFCSLRDCNPDGDTGVVKAPGIPDEETYCGTSNECLYTDTVPPIASQCFRRCDTADECARGFACNDSLLSGTGAFPICWIECIDNETGQPDSSYCRTGEVCMGNVCVEE